MWWHGNTAGHAYHLSGFISPCSHISDARSPFCAVSAVTSSARLRYLAHTKVRERLPAEPTTAAVRAQLPCTRTCRRARSERSCRTARCTHRRQSCGRPRAQVTTASGSHSTARSSSSRHSTQWGVAHTWPQRLQQPPRHAHAPSPRRNLLPPGIQHSQPMDHASGDHASSVHQQVRQLWAAHLVRVDAL